MPLAGKMRLNTFVLMIVASVAVGGSGLFIYRSLQPEPPAPEPPAPALTAHPEITAQPEVTSQNASSSLEVSEVSEPGGVGDDALAGAREVDRYLLEQIGRDLGTGKLKDAAKGKPYKVNLYQDDGNASVNRAKIDLDRDDKWDEKITFEEGGGVTRKVAPADDEDYTEAYRWDGSGWAPEGG